MSNNFLLLLAAAIISMIAQARVQKAFTTYSRVHCSTYPAEQVAAAILRDAGINDVRIERISGDLTDHYDPKAKVLRLSDSVYGSSSAAAIGVAAHECGHAIQHARGYVPLSIRSMIVPVANFGSHLSIPMVILGLALEHSPLVNIGILLFTGVVIFHLITLPVEFNASNRACRILREMNIMTQTELGGVKKVLGAAAMTYVAAALTAIVQLLRLLGASRRRD